MQHLPIGETVKAGMRNEMEYGMVEYGMEYGMEWTRETLKNMIKDAVVLCICCQQVADTLPYTEQTKNSYSI